MRRTSPLILGGGPAGAAAAIALAAGGVRATILERERETGDALCGGFLSWRTLEALDRLGVPADALNPQAITRLRIFAGPRSAAARLPAPARAVSRRRLDGLLLARAEAAGAAVERGIRVRDVDGACVHLADGETLTSDTVLLATGKHDLRGLLRVPHLPPDPALGLRLRLPARAVAADTIELHLFRGGYAGIAVQEDGHANICMAIARSRLRSAGDPLALLHALAAGHPAFADRLAGLDTSTVIDAIANVPYGWQARTSAAGLYRLGDQAAVIPSLAGEGMGIAIASGAAAAHAILLGVDAPTYQGRFADEIARPIRVARLIRAAAEHPASAHWLTTLGRIPWLVRAVAHLTRVSHPPIDAGAAPAHI